MRTNDKYVIKLSVGNNLTKVESKMEKEAIEIIKCTNLKQEKSIVYRKNI
jgi:hypothetical protein